MDFDDLQASRETALKKAKAVIWSPIPATSNYFFDDAVIIQVIFDCLCHLESLVVSIQYLHAEVLSG